MYGLITPARRRIVAVAVDVAAQGLLVWVTATFPSYNRWTEWLVPFVPFAYSCVVLIAGASPAQLMLGLRVVATGDAPRRAMARVCRALIVKSPYLVLLGCSILGTWLDSIVIIELALILPVVILGFFVVALIGIESDSPAFYDVWLGTTVVDRRELAQSKRGFAVITERRNVNP